MILSINNIKFNNTYSPKINYQERNLIKNLPHDTVSFGSNDEPSEEIGARIDFTKKVFETIGIVCKVCDDGYLMIDEYRQPSETLTFKDVGLDENELFLDIKRIRGNADFSRSEVTDLGVLKRIGRNADFRKSKVKNLGDLESIKGNAYFDNSKVQSLGKLKNISRNANFYNSKIEDVGILQRIGGDVCIKNSKLKKEDFKNIEILGQIKD